MSKSRRWWRRKRSGRRRSETARSRTSSARPPTSPTPTCKLHGSPASLISSASAPGLHVDGKQANGRDLGVQQRQGGRRHAFVRYLAATTRRRHRGRERRRSPLPLVPDNHNPDTHPRTHHLPKVDPLTLLGGVHAASR